jgi:hypothetical protein
MTKRMKSFYKILLTLTITFISLAGIFHIATAAILTGEYQPLAPIDIGPTKVRTDLSGLIIDGFRIAVAVSALLAVIMIVIGGFQYMATDKVFSKGEARKRIQSAIYGLLLVMFTFLILQTINPSFVDVSALVNDLKPGGIPTTTSNSNKVIPENTNGNLGATQSQQYSYRGSNGTRYTVTALKSEDLNNLSDKDFYSFKVVNAPVEVQAPNQVECQRLQGLEPSSQIVNSCHQQAPNQPTYVFTKSVPGATVGNLTLQACQFQRSSISSSGQTATECAQTALQ